ncbi:MAG: NADH-quinone oxidoreductase subunit NuoK [Omnitrophica WOR_2 bacterium]|jgi:NADH-quinone oxidoreductase subunit K
MITVSIEIQLLFAAVLFLLGLVGVIVRRNILFMLMSIEVMFNSAGLVFIIAGSHWGMVDGQVMFIFILSVAAAEVSVALAIILQMYHHYKTIDVDELKHLKDQEIK